MRKRHETVDRYITEAQGHQATGDYRSALIATREALSAIEREPVPFEMEARVLLLAARNSYYLSGFDESSIYLDMLAELIRSVEVDACCERYEAAVIRANILRRQGEYRAALQELDDMDGSVENCLDGTLAGEKYLIEGACCYFLDDTLRAREILETALGLTTSVSSWKLRARVLTMMGLVLRRLGFMRKAADDLRRAAAACSKNDDEYGLAAALLNLGITQFHMGESDSAERSFIKATSLFERVNWHIGRCRCLIALGNAASRRDALDEALELFSDASRLAKEQGYRRELALSLSGIASIHISRRDLVMAQNCLARARDIVSEIAPVGDVAAEIARKTGELEIARGDIKAARDRLEDAESIAGGLDAPLELGLVFRAMGRAEACRVDLDTVKALFERAQALIRRSGSTFELARTCLIYAETLLSRTDKAQKAEITGNSKAVEPWSLLWEARHLFAGMNAQLMVDRVDSLLGHERRGGAVPARLYQSGETDSDLIEVGFSSDYKVCNGMVAVSPVMHDVWERIQFAASYRGPVLVTGETGTGKELVARLIHNSSERASGPFVAVNCAAIPDHLFESEFFGHRKGSFTGAVVDRRGFFEEASGGTLFLDEVGELSTLHQAKLLRVLQEGRIRRLGENGEQEVDIKLVSATNQDLGSKLSDLSLREDFFFRINSERIHIPPLRDRREDIIPLMVWRLCGNGNGNGGRTVRIDRGVLSVFQKYHWPGNVRELISIADRLSCYASDSPITIEMLPDRMTGVPAGTHDLDFQGNGDSSRRRIESAMNICRGNKSAAARWLGISRGKLYKELKKTGLDRYYRRT
jgi:transcriptional regulator with AAA-type ATPase domain/tetratricopeptide (TPR) repeat protein